MLKILVLFFLLVGCAGANPHQNKCSEEHEKVSRCQNEVHRKFGEVFLSNFQINERAILEFEKCLGPITCQITKLRLELFNQKQKMYQKFKSISCLNDFIYRSAQISCLGTQSDNCDMSSYIDCVANRLLQEENCKRADTDHFRTLLSDFENYCVVKSNLKSLKLFKTIG